MEQIETFDDSFLGNALAQVWGPYISSVSSAGFLMHLVYGIEMEDKVSFSSVDPLLC